MSSNSLGSPEVVSSNIIPALTALSYGINHSEEPPRPPYIYLRVWVAFLKFEEKVLIYPDVFGASLGKNLLGYYG